MWVRSIIVICDMQSFGIHIIIPCCYISDLLRVLPFMEGSFITPGFHQLLLIHSFIIFTTVIFFYFGSSVLKLNSMHLSYLNNLCMEYYKILTAHGIPLQNHTILIL